MDLRQRVYFVSSHVERHVTVKTWLLVINTTNKVGLFGLYFTVGFRKLKNRVSWVRNSLVCTSTVPVKNFIQN